MASPAALEDLDWPADAQDWLATWAWSGLRFTADDMRTAFRSPPTPNMIGAAFRAACTAKVIRPVGFIESKAPSRNGAIIRVWIGTTENETTSQENENV